MTVAGTAAQGASKKPKNVPHLNSIHHYSNSLEKL